MNPSVSPIISLSAVLLVSIGQAWAENPQVDPAVPSLANQTKSLEPEPQPVSDASSSEPAKPSVANPGQIVLPPPRESRGDAAKAASQDSTVSASTSAALPEPSGVPILTRRDAAIERGRGDSVPWYRHGLVSLVAVLAVIALLAYLARKFMPSVRTMNGGAIEVLGRSHLASKQTLVLVRIGRRVLLLGATGDRIATLCEVQDPSEVAELLVSSSRGGPAGNTDRFAGALRDSTNGFADGEEPPLEFVRGPSQELRRTKGRLQSLLGRLESMREAK